MADKVKVLADLSTLTKMCRSKSDGATLVIEEKEIGNGQLNTIYYEESYINHNYATGDNDH